MADSYEKTGNPIIDAQQERVAQAAGHDRKRLRLALGIALAVHLAFLIVKLPEMTEAQVPEEPEEEPYLVHQVKFRPPPPPPPEEPPPPVPDEPPPPEAETIPIPDPDPQEPEPVREPPPEPIPEPPPRHEEVVRIVEQPVPTPAPAPPTPEIEVEIPAPPPPPPAPEPTGPIRVGGDVKAPIKVTAPDPEYTEAARAAKVQGVVIVEAIIDKQGRVTSTRIVKDQPMGLGASAERAIRSWRFKPATLNGKPVEVYYNLTVNFQLD